MKTRTRIGLLLLLAAVVLLQLAGWWMAGQTPAPAMAKTWGSLGFLAFVVSILVTLSVAILWNYLRYQQARKWHVSTIVTGAVLVILALVFSAGGTARSWKDSHLSSEYVLRGELHYPDGTTLYLYNFVSWIGVGDDHTRSYSIWVQKGWLPVMEYNRPASYGTSAAQVDGKIYRFSITEKESGEAFTMVN